MKKFRPFILVSFLFSLNLLTAQEGGIVFFEGTVQELFAEAKKQNRIIFVDAYAEWCGPCKQMSRNIFPDPKAGSFYNQHFINYKLDMEKGEGPAFARQYQIRVYPTLLFLDSAGTLLHRVAGGRNIDAFIALGQRALDPENRLHALKTHFESPLKDPDKVIEYAIALKDAYLDHQPVIEDYFRQAPSTEKLTLRWKNAVMIFALPGMPEFNHLLEHQSEFTDDFGKEKVFTKITQSFYNPASQILRRNRNLNINLIVDSVFKTYSFPNQEMYKLQILSTFCNQLSLIEQYETHSMLLLEKYLPLLPEKTAYDIFRTLSNRSENSGVLLKAEAFARQAANKYNTYPANYAYALLLVRNNKLTEARLVAGIALEMAKANGNNPAETHELLEQIQRKEESR